MLTPHEALEKYFGHTNFRDGQEETIQSLLNNQHTLLVMPTGSGKSLTYQLPAMLQPGLTLVISPLIALMKDQVDGLVEAGLPATYINSSLSTPEINSRMRAVLEGDIKLLYIAPERLRNRQFTRSLARATVSLLAVDEAHCISQWGHDFRPDYLQIGPTWQAMGKPTLLATTATATPAVQKDIVTLLGAEHTQTLVTGFNRPNLTFQVKHTPDDRTKLQTLQALLKEIDGSVIVYTATRRNADEVADFIQRALGLPTHSYHAGLDRDWRVEVQNKFMADRIKIVVATNAFGMGVDKADVRAVIHYNLPGTVEAYYQEAGRAGRDDLPANCLLLFAPDDQRLQEWFIDSDTPVYEDLYQIYTLLANAAQDEELHVTHQELAASSGMHPVKLRVTLNELEQASLIYHMGNEGTYSHWKIMPMSQQALEERAEAIQKRAEIRHSLLANILNYAHLTTCRRKFILEYFGDTTPPRAPHCCDNHAETEISDMPKATAPHDWYPLIVLDTVRSLKQRPIGRSRLAQLLNGSRRQAMKQFGYDRHRFYGKLGHLSQKQVVQLVDALIQTRYLQLEGGELPVLKITSFGEEALNLRVALPIPAPEMPLPAEAPSPRPTKSDTVDETLRLVQEGLVPAQIATRRGLTEQTIYSHLAKLIETSRLELADLVSDEIEQQILAAVETVGSAAQLTPIKQVLPETINFGQIRCVLAAHPDLPKEALDLPKPEKPATHIEAVENKAPQAQASPSTAVSASPDKVVLEAVAGLGETLGRTGLVKFLTGSRASWLEPFADHSYYGTLAGMSQRAVLDIIDALIADEKLVTSGGFRPKVKLPDQALASQPAPEPEPQAPAKVEVDANAEVEVSSDRKTHLLKALQVWRTEEARRQGVPPFFVFSNKVLETVVAQTPYNLAELGKIPGIGPVKLEKYGEAVIALVREIIETDDKVTEAPPRSQAVIDAPKPVVASKYQVLEDKIKEITPREAILTTLEALGGLLTSHSLAVLLTAAPGEVVPFNDQALCGLFYGKYGVSELEREIREAIREGVVSQALNERLSLS